MRKGLIVLALGLVLALGVVGCAKQAGSREQNIPVSEKVGTAKDGNEQKIESPAINLVKDAKEGGYEIATVEELKAAIDSGEKMTMIDTMPADTFAKGRIPGALNAELPKEGEATAEQIDAFAKLLPSDKNEKVVIYCGFTACRRSHIGAAYAVKQGYTNVVRVPGGIVAWGDAGYTAEK